MNQKIIKYQLISASGNPTAIIKGEYDPDTKRSINQRIFSPNNQVEQIAYVRYSNNRYNVEMMGNEFLGNDCRAAAFSFLKSKSGKIKLNTSGTTKVIDCLVDQNQNSTVDIPYSFSPKKILNNKIGFLIKIFGSYQLIIKGRGSLSQARKIIDSQFIDSNAVGIMFFEKITGGYKLDPFFWVKGTQTLVNETACGSGSTALAIYLSYINKKSYQSLRILQPSKLPIFIDTIFNNNSVTKIKISGPTKLLGNYNVKI